MGKYFKKKILFPLVKIAFSYLFVLFSSNILLWGLKGFFKTFNLIENFKYFFDVRNTKSVFTSIVKRVNGGDVLSIVCVILLFLSLFTILIQTIVFYKGVMGLITYKDDKDLKNLKGSSKWETEKGIVANKYAEKWDDFENDRAKSGIILAQSENASVEYKDANTYITKKNGKYIYMAPVFKEMGKSPVINHTFIFGASGSGKGVGTIIPTLLSYKGSCICYDPACENYEETAGYRASIGKVLYFNPQDKNSTCCFNPLTFIRKDEMFIVSDISNLAMIIVPKTQGGDAFWDNSARDLLIIYIAYILLFYPTHKQNLYEVCHITSLFDDIKREKEMLKDEDEDDEDEEIGFIDLLKKMEADCEKWLRDEGESESGAEFRLCDDLKTRIRNLLMAAKSENTMASIIKVLDTHISFFADPNIARLMNSTSFTLEDFFYEDKPLTIYLSVLNEDTERCKTFIRVFFELITTQCSRDYMRYKKEGKHTLLYLIDEFPKLGYMKSVEEEIPFVRKYGINYLLISQDKAQLERHYKKEGASSILTNCMVIDIKKVNDIETAEWLSRILGKQTIEYDSTSYSTQKGSIAPTSSSQSVQREGRNLLDPAEIVGLKVDKEIVKITGLSAVMANKVQWFHSPVLLKRNKIKLN